MPTPSNRFINVSSVSFTASTDVSGSVTGVAVTAAGSGYTSAPAVGFSGGAGSGAAGTAVISGGAVVGVIVTARGTGYTSAPAVAFTGGGGSGAAATASLGGPATVAIRGVQSITLSPNAADVSDGGDGDVYNTTGTVVFIDNQISVEFLNVQATAAVPVGAYGTLTWTLNDSRNQATTAGGAIIYTVVNCYFLPQGVTAQFRQLAKNTMMVKTFSPDGQTNPVSTAAA